MKLSKIGSLLISCCFSGVLIAQSVPIEISLYSNPIDGISTSTNRASIRKGSALLIPYLIKNNLSTPIQFSPILDKSVHPVIAAAASQTSEAGHTLVHCSNSLAPHGACLMLLMIAGSEVPSAGLRGGPVIQLKASSILGETYKNNPFWQYQPDAAQQLDITPSNETATGLTASVSGITLSVNDTTLNSALTGKKRSVSIKNTTGSTISISSTIPRDLSLPTGTSVTRAGCDHVQNEGTCTLTITPGAEPTTTPIPMVIYGGANTNAITLPINILTYGTIYQSGYVFSVDDTTDSTVSALGKVAALKNQEPFWPFGIIWASNGQTGCTLDEENGYAPCTYYTFIPGITETSTVQAGDACNGNSDGNCDTTQIISAVNTQSITVSESLYAAGVCNSLTIGNYNDWYLPSICEMGYFVTTTLQTIDSGCGTQEQPLMQNMASNLADRGIGELFGVNWSSTEYSGGDGTTNNAWSQYYLGQTRYQTHDGKEDPSGVRCVRALTQP